MNKESYMYQFNLTRYFELQNKSSSLLTSEETLSESEALELAEYVDQLFVYFCWQEKENFLSLIESFLNFELDIDDFYIRSYHLTRSTEDVARFSSFETLKTIKLEDSSEDLLELKKNLVELINSISSTSELYEIEMEDSIVEKFTQEKYRNKIIDFYQKYKGYQKAILSDEAIDVKAVIDPLAIESSSKISFSQVSTEEVIRRSYNLLRITCVTGGFLFLVNNFY